MRTTRPAVVRAAIAGFLLLAAAPLSGCGQGTDDTAMTSSEPLSTAGEAPTPSPAPTSSSSSSSSSSSGAAESSADAGDPPFVPLAQGGEGSATGTGSSSITGVRVGEHDGWVRVVIDLQGDASAAPGWFANAVDSPVQDTSGDVLDVDGDRFLDLGVSSLANGATEDVDSAGRKAFHGDVDGSGVVEEVHVGSAWEGQAQVLVGLDSTASEYRVLRLSDPSRVVVDVR